MQRLSRRAFLSGAAGAGFALGAAGTLTACGGSGSTGLTANPRLPAAASLTWPLTPANPPLRGGLAPETGATLRLLTWPSYVSPAVAAEFGRTYRCAVDVTTVATPAELLTRLRSGSRYDVIAGASVSTLASLAGGELIQPLNHAYLPDQSAIWSLLRSPYYDQGARYTVPTGVYTTGIAWRTDKVPGSPYELTSGWQFAWQPKYRDRVGILDDYRAGVGLGLLATGSLNLNTADPGDLNQAQRALASLIGGRAGRIDSAAARSLTAGRTWIHQATSAQITAAARSAVAAAAHVTGRSATAAPGTGQGGAPLGYWFPPSGYGPVACEVGAVVRGASSPVLAHAFLDFSLKLPNALANAAVNGRTPPLSAATPRLLVDQGVVPGSLASTVILQEELRRGLVELPLPPAADGLWLRAWRDVGGLA